VPCTENTFANHESEPTDSLILHSDHCAIVLYPITVSKLLLEPEISNPEHVCRMSSVLQEKVVEEVLIDLMTERVMSMYAGIQASLMR
jgi:hypothetical protein